MSEDDAWVEVSCIVADLLRHSEHVVLTDTGPYNYMEWGTVGKKTPVLRMWPATEWRDCSHLVPAKKVRHDDE